MDLMPSWPRSRENLKRKMDMKADECIVTFETPCLYIIIFDIDSGFQRLCGN